MQGGGGTKEGSMDDQSVDQNHGDQGKGEIGSSVCTQDTIEGVSDLG